MRCLGLVLATFLVLAPLINHASAQDAAADAAIQAAQAAGKPELLETSAAKLEETYRYDDAYKLLEAALDLRAQIDGDQSADYALCLLKLGALERKTGRTKEAADHYATAVRLLPGRPETAPVFLYLGIGALGRKDFANATENLQRAQSLDIALAGPVLMWTALMRERQNQIDDAETLYKSALAIEKPESTGAFETRTLYARFLKQRGRDNDAQQVEGQLAASKTKQFRLLTKTSPGTYRPGVGVSAPSVLHKIDPRYSEEARVAKYSGTVLLQTIVDVNGNATEIQVLKSAGFGLDECAIATLSKWRFKPGQIDTQPVPVRATVEINFRLL